MKTSPSRKKAQISGLYAIADEAWNPFQGFRPLILKFLQGGAKIVQLRMKNSSPGEVRRDALLIAALKKDFDFTFILNDHADIAAEVGADGVHVGENDEPVADIKKRHGERLIVGYSSHSIDEAHSAQSAGADYIAFGAIFHTMTKGPGHPVQGIEKLRALAASVSLPVVAIGGICRENIRDVISAGADSVAMITALSQASDISGEVAYYSKMFDDVSSLTGKGLSPGCSRGQCGK
ncbi:MAG: Thiamine-phosphate synthase [bacterium ADurb.Bin270]|jgi:thiamine-phosphate pyrophosphorylase|nr:MAG: Thiamine-phosphate synthase [bacterium ADurb.Bin270]